MSPNQSYSRVDTLELKALILRQIGRERAERYFDQLSRLFSFKVSKRQFDKFCFQTIGRENVPLHNRLIKAIIKNACLAKFPPSKGVRKVDGTLNVKIPNGYQRNSLQSIYGDAFPPSPRKSRSPVYRDSKFRDRPSPLGPHGKPQRVLCNELVCKVQEQQSATELVSLDSRPPAEVASVEDGEEVEQVAGSPGVIQSRSLHVTAPFGILMNLAGTRKSLPRVSVSNNYHQGTSLSSSELPDTRSLRSHLERKLEMEHMSVSLDCANVLNSALDVYLKRLIEPCMGLSRSRASCISMTDFRVAMELNPLVLGEDWVIQLEKICLHASEE